MLRKGNHIKSRLIAASLLRKADNFTSKQENFLKAMSYYGYSDKFCEALARVLTDEVADHLGDMLFEKNFHTRWKGDEGVVLAYATVLSTYGFSAEKIHKLDVYLDFKKKAPSANTIYSWADGQAQANIEDLSDSDYKGLFLGGTLIRAVNTAKKTGFAASYPNTSQLNAIIDVVNKEFKGQIVLGQETNSLICAVFAGILMNTDQEHMDYLIEYGNKVNGHIKDCYRRMILQEVDIDIIDIAVDNHLDEEQCEILRENCEGDSSLIPKFADLLADGYDFDTVVDMVSTDYYDENGYEDYDSYDDDYGYGTYSKRKDKIKKTSKVSKNKVSRLRRK